jgi:hypothetical protein
MLPLSCWPLEALEELKGSIEAAFQRRTVPVGHDWLVALNWLEAVNAELKTRAAFDLEREVIGATVA